MYLGFENFKFNVSFVIVQAHDVSSALDYIYVKKLTSLKLIVRMM